ncbi:MAG TPA: SpoIIE family protein phosphatase [Ktedonobacteraceae bacterium]|nr:SpoIIE family protein phosphatase [Ktedonobacteraceae bacterium]
MTITYVGVSVASALLVELLLASIFFLIILRLPFVDQNTIDTANHAAQFYALEAAVQAGGTTLDPRTTFQPDQPLSLTLPAGDATLDPKTIAFALLIAPDGQVLASSDPGHYPLTASATQKLPGQAQIIRNALAGNAGNTVVVASQGHVASVAQPVLNKEKQPIGAVYVQMQPVGTFSGGVFSVAGGLLFTALFWLIITAPIGAVFGVLATRSLVRRLHRLVRATGQFAQGDYSQRVQVSRKDEIGQLESQFNQMAGQLVESIAQQQVLTEQQARLEERARIEQELLTARYIQQALLPKAVPTLPGWQLAPFYRPAREVGGDFYDFLPLEDGCLGLVIGDATGKGVPAALVMTTTCTMLRAASQGTLSPGKVLAQVNDLLSANIPSGMFATCFYAILDPGSGRLRYANAGQDWPYRQHSGGIAELQATGMPLGMMPGTCYDEHEAMLAPGESVFFFSDGLVEAHNQGREMFGRPHLATLLETSSGGITLIDDLLEELASFTGGSEEQEDDITLILLRRSAVPSEEEIKLI